MSGLPAAVSPGAELLLRTAGETLYDTICPLLPNTFVPVVILKLESLCDPLVRKASSAKLIKIFYFPTSGRKSWKNLRSGCQRGISV